MNNKVAAIILGAGKGTRMKSDKPKVLMPVCGKPMIKHIIDTLKTIPVDEIVTVISPDGDTVAQTVAPYKTCVQEAQLGTGHAVNCAKDLLKGFDGPILVIFGDTPLITKQTFENLRAAIKKDLHELTALNYEKLKEQRTAKFLKIGSQFLQKTEEEKPKKKSKK